MLTGELKKNIDSKWDACWPLNLLKPVAILDLISYLFFLKKLSQNHLTDEKSANNKESIFIQSKESKILETGVFNELESENFQPLLSLESTDNDLLKNYVKSLSFGVFVKGGLHVAPTQKLLANAVAVLGLIENGPKNVKGAIFEYLLYKKELTDPGGHTYLPRCLVNLIISILQPGEKDFILDPSAGDGSLLVESARYLASKNPGLKNVDPKRFVGLESDLTSLRIAAMNMILNGIENPEMKAIDSYSGFSSVTIGHPTIIVANLIFSGSESKMIVEGNSIKEITRKEILYLNFIIKNAGNGTRIVVIVPDVILYNNTAEFVSLRKEILDRFKVEAVISLNDKNVLPFFGSSILVFRKEIPAMGDRVWFYKLKHCKADGNIVSENNTQNEVSDAVTQMDGMKEILNHFENNVNEKSKDPDSFYVDTKDIREKNYSLSYNEICLSGGREKTILVPENNFSEKEEMESNLKKQNLFPTAEKLPETKKNSVKKIITFCCLLIMILGIGYGVYWFFYLKNDSVKPSKYVSVSVVVADSAKPVAVTVPVSDSSAVNKVIQNKKGIDSLPNLITRYTVRSGKAYFYLSPDINTRREIFLTNLVNAIVTPKEDKNGFVYVVYVNKRGQTTHGWIKKSDLKPLP